MVENIKTHIMKKYNEMLGKDPEMVAEIKAELAKDVAKHFESITDKPVLIWTPTSDVNDILQGLK